ncbi:NTP transferase domain-containing protein, partial [Erwinia psidii]|uniref:NTP transferase domain-containing protein n=1 Tax=Erwinia psidii TaxID=69224 RepID=UPI002B462815
MNNTALIVLVPIGTFYNFTAKTQPAKRICNANNRMGGKDKGLIVWREKPLWQHVLSRLAPQTGKVCINANRN